MQPNKRYAQHTHANPGIITIHENRSTTDPDRSPSPIPNHDEPSGFNQPNHRPQLQK